MGEGRGEGGSHVGEGRGEGGSHVGEGRREGGREAMWEKYFSPKYISGLGTLA